MPDFSFKIHQIQFRLELRPRPHWKLYLGKARGEEGKREGKCAISLVISTHFRAWII